MKMAAGERLGYSPRLRAPARGAGFFRVVLKHCDQAFHTKTETSLSEQGLSLVSISSSFVLGKTVMTRISKPITNTVVGTLFSKRRCTASLD